MNFNTSQNITLSTTIVTNTTMAPIMVISYWIRNNILGPILAYFLPITVFITIVNNILVLIIFFLSKDISKGLTPSIRVYYIATAIADIVVVLPVHFSYFIGIACV